MRSFESPGVLESHRKVTWEFQKTFHTSLQDLTRFVDRILSALPGVNGALISFDQVVFEPRYELVPLIEKHSLSQNWFGDGVMVVAQGETEVRELLEAALSEWIDFFAVPMPESFVMCADHDEYITFFAHHKDRLSEVIEALISSGFRAVEYVREF